MNDSRDALRAKWRSSPLCCRYQPLVRDVLVRFVPNALKEILEVEQAKATLANKKALLPERRK